MTKPTSTKAKGGRGQKAKNPYGRFSATLPPELLTYLDEQAQQAGVARSEALARILAQHQAQATTPAQVAPVHTVQAQSSHSKPSEGPSEAKGEGEAANTRCREEARCRPAPSFAAAVGRVETARGCC